MTSRRPPARLRILEAADRLFAEQGIRAVGVDAIVEAADTAKTTLYSHFGSKDALVVAYLQRRAEQARDRVQRGLVRRDGSAMQRILHLYDLLAEELAAPGHRGSPFVNACVELGSDHPAVAVARDHRRWLLDTFAGLAAEADTPDPGALAAQLVQLYESATIAPQLGDGTAARVARAAATALLSAPEPPVDKPTLAAALHPGSSPEAHRLVAFLNSVHLPDGDDHLADDRAGPWLAEWLSEARAAAPAARADAMPAAPELLVVREGLRQLAAVNCGAGADPRAVAEATAVLEQTPLLVDLAAGAEPRLTARDAADAAGLAIAVVANAYVAVRARGEWARLKVCASPDCRWAFFDTTRNRSRRWCDMAGCGNRAKSRAWRDRQNSVTVKTI